MDKNVTIIEKRICFLREQRHLTQEELASMLHVSRSLINNWENGYTNLSLKQLIKLASIYQVPVDYLLGIINEIDAFPYAYIQEMDLKTIGSKLKDIRKFYGLTQEQFAQKIDTKRSSISYYESGKMMISTADLKQICETFGVSADYIVGNLEENIPREKKVKITIHEIKEKVSN